MTTATAAATTAATAAATTAATTAAATTAATAAATTTDANATEVRRAASRMGMAGRIPLSPREHGVAFPGNYPTTDLRKMNLGEKAWRVRIAVQCSATYYYLRMVEVAENRKGKRFLRPLGQTAYGGRGYGCERNELPQYHEGLPVLDKLYTRRACPRAGSPFSAGDPK